MEEDAPAPVSNVGPDARWVIIQQNTFTNWVNEHLKTLDSTVDNLREDLCDGVKLCDLVVVLQNKKMGRIVRKPVNQHQQLDNVIKALRAIENDNVRLVNIGKFLTLDD